MDEDTGAVQIIKVPSTPADPALGFMAAVERALGLAGGTGDAMRLLVHATTVATDDGFNPRLLQLAHDLTHLCHIEGFQDLSRGS